MSYLFHSLQQFGFSSLEEVTASRLKRAFKRTVAMAHPDKGGDEGRFDAMLGSYVYLCETLHRLNGGRSILYSVNAPDELKEQRANQYLNELFDDLNLEEARKDDKPLPDDFHEQFAASHVNEHANGYDAWFKSGGDQKSEALKPFKEHVEDGRGNVLYGDIQLEEEKVENFHSTFEEKARIGKPAPTTLALHLDDMAYSAGIGTALIKAGSYTSQPGLRPEYVDLYSAYTSENTMFDKLVPIKERTYEELLKEREEVYSACTDEDAAAIAAYAKKKIDDEIEHKKALESYFKNGAFITNGTNEVIINEVITNEVIQGDEKKEESNEQNFVIQL
jgi:hypothetical protein